jgi:hypothetical protein
VEWDLEAAHKELVAAQQALNMLQFDPRALPPGARARAPCGAGPPRCWAARRGHGASVGACAAAAPAVAAP